MKATYTVKVHVDADGDMVIVQNPTLAPAIEKSDYEPKTPEADASVDADTVNDATCISWKHSLSCTRQPQKKSLPTMYREMCLSLSAGTTFMLNW